MKNNKILEICIRGKWYKIAGNGNFWGSESWKFLGVSTHHWHNRIIHKFSDIWDNPQLAVNGYLWDLDHGTTRLWGGSYCGQIPRITSCFKSNQ